MKVAISIKKRHNRSYYLLFELVKEFKLGDLNDGGVDSGATGSLCGAPPNTDCVRPLFVDGGATDVIFVDGGLIDVKLLCVPCHSVQLVSRNSGVCDAC